MKVQSECALLKMNDTSSVLGYFFQILKYLFTQRNPILKKNIFQDRNIHNVMF